MKSYGVGLNVILNRGATLGRHRRGFHRILWNKLLMAACDSTLELTLEVKRSRLLCRPASVTTPELSLTAVRYGGIRTMNNMFTLSTIVEASI